jgi:hypothetical protein
MPLFCFVWAHKRGNSRDIVRYAHSSPKGFLMDADYFCAVAQKIIGIRKSPLKDE